MARDQSGKSSGFELTHFERNRYFQGKLMNAQDMKTEQRYHTDRLETLTRVVDGVGVVSGLAVSEFTQREDTLEVTVQPGVAVDPHGRPIVVRNPATRTFAAPTGDEAYVYIEYDTETKDPVPVPGKRQGSQEGSEENRELEVFEITTKETSPERYKTPSPVGLSELLDRTESPQELAEEVARTYHESSRSTVETGIDPAVFLGSFKRTASGDWQRGEETGRRPHLYDNDMLYALLVEHIADTDNPHGTRIGEPSEYVESELDQIEGFRMRLQDMHEDLRTVTEKLDLHSQYTRDKSLKTTVRFFDDLADRFEHSGEISRRALAVVDAVEDAIHDGVAEDPDAYLEFVDDLVDDVSTLADALSGETTEASYRQFESVVEQLERLSDEEPTVIEVAQTMDKLGETAELLEERTEVIPENED